MTKLTRRRFIFISAAIAGASLILPGFSLPKTKKLFRWRGRAMGTKIEILLNVRNSQQYQHVISSIKNEILRLEKIFSLYRDDSAISKLNSNGYIIDPPIELVDLVRRSINFSNFTQGAFDITVQPLWQFHTKNTKKTDTRKLNRKVLKLVDYNSVNANLSEIRFAKPDMAITFNGIAQGYITDKVSSLLSSYGMKNCLLQLGETKGLGPHPSGRRWKVGIQDPFIQNKIIETVFLKNNFAIATSNGNSTFINNNPKVHHIFNPLTGLNSNYYDSVSVISKDATTADALSTGFMNMDLLNIKKSLGKIKYLKVVLIKNKKIIKLSSKEKFQVGTT